MKTLTQLIPSIQNLPNNLTPLHHPDYLTAIRQTLSHELNLNEHQIHLIMDNNYITTHNKYKIQSAIKRSFTSPRLRDLSEKDLAIANLFLEKYRNGINKNINYYSCLSIDLHSFAKTLYSAQTQDGIHYTLNNKPIFNIENKQEGYTHRTSISISHKLYFDILDIIEKLPFRLSFTELFFNFIYHYTERNNALIQH